MVRERRLSDWSSAELERKLALIEENERKFGSEGTAQLMVQLGFPMLADPLDGSKVIGEPMARRRMN